jgi:hypothetical protein
VGQLKQSKASGTHIQFDKAALERRKFNQAYLVDTNTLGQVRSGATLVQWPATNLRRLELKAVLNSQPLPTSGNADGPSRSRGRYAQNQTRFAVEVDGLTAQHYMTLNMKPAKKRGWKPGESDARMKTC